MRVVTFWDGKALAFAPEEVEEVEEEETETTTETTADALTVELEADEGDEAPEREDERGHGGTEGLHDEASRDALSRRRTPRLPGVAVRPNGSSVILQGGRGTGGWARTGTIHPRRVHRDSQRARALNPTGNRARPHLGDNEAQITTFLVEILGAGRVGILLKALSRRGQATREELEARAYLACLLRGLGRDASFPAALLLVHFDPTDGRARDRALRKIGDLRRRAYTPELEAHARAILRADIRLERWSFES